MANKIIKLSTPITGHDGPIHQVVLREPRFEEYREIGDPFIVAQTADGIPYMVEKTEAIRQYEELLLVEPRTAALLSQGGWRLARDIRQAVLGFFLQGDEAGEDSKTSPTTSSSSDNSQPSTSIA